MNHSPIIIPCSFLKVQQVSTPAQVPGYLHDGTTPLAGSGMTALLSVPTTPVAPVNVPVMSSTPSHGKYFVHF